MPIARSPRSRLRSTAARAWWLLCAGALAPAVADAGAGIAGADVLKMPVEARGWGLGTAYSAIADDVGAIGYNPAGLALSGERELRLTYLKLIGGSSYESILGGWPLGRWGSLGLLFQFRQVPDIDNGAGVLDAPDASGFVHPVEVHDSVTGGYIACRFSHLLPGVKFVEPVAVGIGAKKVNSTLGGFTAGTMLADLGLRVTFDVVRFAIAVNNLGGGYRFAGSTDAEAMPTTLRTALAVIPVEDAASSLVLTVENASYVDVNAGEKQADDSVKTSRESLDVLAIAAEFWRLKKMGVRLAYTSPWGDGAPTAASLRGIAMGVSFRVFTSHASYQVDIAYRPLSLGTERQDAGTISLGLRF